MTPTIFVLRCLTDRLAMPEATQVGDNLIQALLENVAVGWFRSYIVEQE